MRCRADCRNTMPKRLKRYLSALLLVSSLCAVYQVTFARWLDSGEPEKFEFAGPRAVARNASLAQIYPPDAWQLGNCKRLQTRDGILLFGHWEQIGDDQWKLWPLSVVLGTNSETPLVIDAPEGAEIKFAESLDMMSGGAPPIEHGRLIGEVRIRSVGKELPLEAKRGDEQILSNGHLELVSSDFGIDFRKIWTTQPISVKLGRVQLRGRDLTLHLAPLGRLQSSGDTPLSILNRMELIYLDELSVPLPEDGLWGAQAAAARAGMPPAVQPTMPPVFERLPSPSGEPLSPAMARFRCAGRVLYQFATNELTLENRVVLEHRTPAAVDVFECDLLTLRFADLLNRKPAYAPGDPIAQFLGTSPPADQPPPTLDDYLLGVVAEGTPARIKLPSFGADVAAERLDFNARQGLLKMSGVGGARITYGGHTWRFKDFSYQLNPTDPKKIGTFHAAGSGLVEFSPAAELPLRRLRWSDGVRLEQPDEKGEFTLQVDGNVSAQTADDGEFQCQSAMLVLRAQDNSLQGDSWLRSIQPLRFQASGQVTIASPALNVATRLLRLYFDFTEPAPPAAADPATLAATDQPESIRRWVRQPQDDDAASGNQTLTVGAATPVRKPSPTIHGDTINAKLKLAGSELTASDLTVVGNVTLRHSLDLESGTLPAVLTGERLQLRGTEGDEVLQIGSGLESPAKLTLGDGFFIGPLIQVRLADNVVWIKEAGEFQVPSQMLPSSIDQSPAIRPIEAAEPAQVAARQQSRSRGPSNMQWISPPRCRWRGQMLFDGSRVTLTDGVEIRGAVVAGDEQDVWDFELLGDQINVAMVKTLQMNNPDSMRQAAVDQVNITSTDQHPVVITVNQLSSQGTRKSRHVLTTPELVMRPDQSLLSGVGGGWYRAWMKSGGGGVAAGVTSGGFRPTEPSFQGLHLLFQESLQADFNAQSLQFRRGVRIATREVSSWDDVIDAETMHGLRLGESTLDCDTLRLALVDAARGNRMTAASRPTAPWEVEAIGNVRFQTRVEQGLYNGAAHRATYTADKNMFHAVGDAARHATMSHTLPTGAPGESITVKSFTMNTVTMEMSMEFDRMQLGTLPLGEKGVMEQR